MSNFSICGLLICIVATLVQAKDISSFPMDNNGNNRLSVIKLSPEVRVHENQDISLEHNRLFAEALLQNKVQYDNPMVFLDQTPPQAVIIGNRIQTHYLSSGDLGFAKVLDNTLRAGEELSIVHSGEKVPVQSGSSDKTEGWKVGSCLILKINKGIASFKVLSVKREILINDLLVRTPDALVPAIQFKYGISPIDGKIISSVESYLPSVLYSIIRVNRGSAEGISPGNVLRIYSETSFLRDSLIPDSQQHEDDMIRYSAYTQEPSALAVVFKTYPHIADASILKARTPVYHGDLFIVETRNLL